MEQLKVVFVLTAHAADDDRVFYHQAVALEEVGISTHIVAFRTNHILADKITILNPENTTRSVRIQLIVAELNNSKPNVVIADTPTALRAATLYKQKADNTCKIIYDITEWYPSKKNLRNVSLFEKPLKYCILAAFNVSMSKKCDGFIFGENLKSKPYKFLFPRKKNIVLPYYPDIQYIKPIISNISPNVIKLLYAGPLTSEKGFFRVLEVARTFAISHPTINVVLNVISENCDKNDIVKPESLQIIYEKWLPFEKFCEKSSDSDLFFDFRDTDAENQRCLPIKLFYYMAMGKPVIYSNLKAIKDGCPEIETFGYMVNPDDIDSIVSIIDKYLDDKELYRTHSQIARKLFLEKYNWQNIKNDFVTFIKTL